MPRFIPRLLTILLISSITVILSVPCLVRQVKADDTAVLSSDASSVVLNAQAQRMSVMQQASTATVAIFGLDGGGGGSGVIVTPDGYALTNYHVSSACGDHMRCGLNDGKVYDAVIVGVDATGDVSLIKLLGRDDFPTAPLGDSDSVRVGQWCFAAGNPFVLATNLQPSVSLGLVSGTNRYQYPAGTLLEYADCIQTDAAINPGNSGGPLFNLAGEVIGVNGRCSFEKRGRVNVGVGYAISANQIKHFMGMLRSGRLVDHATLGATVATDDSGRVLVSNILNSSDAYRRGLRFGDEVIYLADREIRTTNAFKNVLGTLPKDWRVPLVIRRDGTNRTLLVRLDGVHTEQELIDLVNSEAASEQVPPGHGPQPPKESSDENPDDSTDQDAAIDSDRPVTDPLPGQPDTRLVKSMLESRTGFANYFFNRENRDRIWRGLSELGDFSSAGEVWSLSGTIAGESTQVRLDLQKQAASIQLGSRKLDVDFQDQLSDIVALRRETGILVALHALRDLLRLGPERIGDTIYIGTHPVYQGTTTSLAQQPRHDVLQSLWYDARVRYSFDPESGQVSLIEVYGDVGHDPIELYLDQYAAKTLKSGLEVRFPQRFRLQYGSEPLLLLTLDSFNTETTPQQSATEPTP